MAGAGAGCGSDPDAQPTVASVDFDPRLVVTVDDGGISAEPGDRSGAEAGGAGGAEWTVPTGSVVDLTVTGDEPHRVVITVSPTDRADDPDAERPWVDAGTLLPGETTVLGLSAAGVYRVSASSPASADPSATLVLEVRPRLEG